MSRFKSFWKGVKDSANKDLDMEKCERLKRVSNPLIRLCLNSTMYLIYFIIAHYKFMNIMNKRFGKFSVLMILLPVIVLQLIKFVPVVSCVGYVGTDVIFLLCAVHMLICLLGVIGTKYIDEH